MELYSATAPQLVSGIDIFGDESNLRIPANEFVIFRAALGSKHRQNSTAIRRRDRHPTVKLEPAIGNYTESELIDIELQASFVIAYEDIGLENTQIGSVLARAGRGIPRVQPPEPWRSVSPGDFRFRVQVDLLSAGTVRRNQYFIVGYQFRALFP
jgi:hypothetical protein